MTTSRAITCSPSRTAGRRIPTPFGSGSTGSRRLIAEGSLPARRMMGRWAIPANAVASFRAKSAGRPMAEQSAWPVLRRLAGESDPMPARLRHRLDGLTDGAAPGQRLRSWMGNRGRAVHLWAFKPALDGLQDDASSSAVTASSRIWSRLDNSASAQTPPTSRTPSPIMGSGE